MDNLTRLRLKSLRARHDHTQRYIANMLGITPATYSRKENGEYGFDVDDIRKLLEIYPEDRPTIIDIFFNIKVTKMERREDAV